MSIPLPRRAGAIAAAILVPILLCCADPALAQAPPTIGTSQHDTNNDGSNDLTVRRTDADGDGVADTVHMDSDGDGVVDPGERVFRKVTGYSVIGGAAGFTFTIVEDTGTEKVKTLMQPLDRNGDGDCSDDGEMVQSNFMPDSVAFVQLFAHGQQVAAQLAGSALLAADLNRIVPAGGLDTVPIEIVAMTLTGGPQPITVRLDPVVPAPGLMTEAIDTMPGRLDARLMEEEGALESFFDVVVEIDLATGRVVTRTPLRLRNGSGMWPPAPLQTYYSMATGPVELVDAATGQPAGFLQRFDWVPHAAPRLDCDCERASIRPIVRTHKDAKTGQVVVDSPAATGAVSATDGKVYDVRIEVEWAATIRCTGFGAGCSASWTPVAVSEGWKVDGKASAPLAPDEHDGTGPDGHAMCEGICGQEISPAAPLTTTYTVSVKKGAGGIVTNKVTGTVTLVMGPLDCAGDPWKMVLVYEADLKKGEVRIDPLLSNWDGDRKINAADKNPLDPARD